MHFGISLMDSLLSRVFPLVAFNRSFRVARYVRPYLCDLYQRRIIQGPEKFRPRSAWKPWNYEAEIQAFGNRIGENIALEVLRCCFVDKSYAYYANQYTSTENNSEVEDNSKLAQLGEHMSSDYIAGFLRGSFPKLPEEWILTIRDRLLSTQELAYVGAHIGINDLLQYTLETERNVDSPLLPSVTGPPTLESIATAFLAIVGSLTRDGSQTTAQLFIRDFILTRLINLELCADFEFPLQNDPFALLEGVLRSQKLGPPEARLQHQSSMNTLLACYQVGIYSDRQLIGEAPGETVEIAEIEATRQALHSLFGIADSRPPLNFDVAFKPSIVTHPNPSLDEYLNFH